MRRNSIFRKLLVLLVLSCFATAALCIGAYCIFGVNQIVGSIADEMVPRATAVSLIANRYITGQISLDTFETLALQTQDGAEFFIFDAQGNLFVYTVTETNDLNADASVLAEYAAIVINDHQPVIDTEHKLARGIIVATPIKDNMRRTVGAIVMIKPAVEVWLAMRGTIIALIICGAAACMMMAVVGYYISKRFTEPIRNMKEVANAMAAGDFSILAPENERNELGELGTALNHLSRELSSNINELKLTQIRLMSILESLNEGVIAVDANMKVNYRNPCAKRFLRSYSENKLVVEIGEQINDVLAGGQTRACDIPLDERLLRATVSFSKQADTNTAGAVILLTDVTEAERLEQTRRDYVANVSHELRTPITAVRNLAETLQDGIVKSEEDRSRYYGYILRESVRLSNLINDLLELSRLQSGSVALSKDVINLSALLKEVAARMDAIADYSDIRLVLHVEDEQLTGYSNAARIEQVLVALLDNAIKYASDSGDVLLSASSTAEKTWIEVSNTGEVPEYALDHVFERFYKVDDSHAESGTGLGLAIVKEVLTALGESVTVENRGGRVVFRFSVTRAV